MSFIYIYTLHITSMVVNGKSSPDFCKTTNLGLWLYPEQGLTKYKLGWFIVFYNTSLMV